MHLTPMKALASDKKRRKIDVYIPEEGEEWKEEEGGKGAPGLSIITIR